jgi:von Willebrand factor type A domain/PEP-CTERM motif
MKKLIRIILLGLFAPFIFISNAHALILADIVWAIDTSGSMGGDITQVKQRITEFNTAMTNNGIDAHYGLVRFGGSETLIQDIVDFTTFTAVGSPFATLTANGGGNEDGVNALGVALTASFRANSVKNLVLVTDENDDSSVAEVANVLASLAAVDPLVNIIGNPNSVGLANSNGAVPEPNTYPELATLYGGQFFNILDFRNTPQTFFTNFINTKVQEIINEGCNPQLEDCGTVPEPGTLVLLGLGLIGLRFAKKRSIK